METSAKIAIVISIVVVLIVIGLLAWWLTRDTASANGPDDAAAVKKPGIGFFGWGATTVAAGPAAAAAGKTSGTTGPMVLDKTQTYPVLAEAKFQHTDKTPYAALPAAKPTSFVFVSKRGKDSNPGTYEAPFASIEKGMAGVRKVGSAAVVVICDSYYFDSVTLSASHAGTAQCPVIVTGLKRAIVFYGCPVTLEAAAAAGDNVQAMPMVSGASSVTQLKFTSAGGGKMKATLPGNVGPFRNCWMMDGQAQTRLVRARSAPLRSATITSTSVTAPELGVTETVPGAEAVVGDQWEIIRIVNTLQNGRIEGDTVLVADKYVGQLKAQPLWIENVPQLLKTAGQFYYDATKKEFTLIPPKGVKTDSVSFAFPGTNARTLLKATGLTNVIFDGIRFSHTDWAFGKRLSNQQASVNEEGMFPAAVELGQGCSNVSLVNCMFDAIGSSALGFLRGSSKCNVTHCVFNDISAAAIQIGDVEENANGSTNNIVVHNCEISWCGVEHGAAAAVFLGLVNNNKVLNSTIKHSSYTGVTIGWGWEQRQFPGLAANTVANCNICDYARFCVDSGGIYTLSDQVGGLLEGNWIHDSAKGAVGIPNFPRIKPVYVFGIYCDNGTGNITLRNNCIEDVIKSWSVHANPPNGPIAQPPNSLSCAQIKQAAGAKGVLIPSPIEGFWQGLASFN